MWPRHLVLTGLGADQYGLTQHEMTQRKPTFMLCSNEKSPNPKDAQIPETRAGIVSNLTRLTTDQWDLKPV